MPPRPAAPAPRGADLGPARPGYAASWRRYPWRTKGIGTITQAATGLPACLAGAKRHLRTADSAALSSREWPLDSASFNSWRPEERSGGQEGDITRGTRGSAI